MRPNLLARLCAHPIARSLGIVTVTSAAAFLLIAGLAPQRPLNVACESNIAQLNAALMQYVQDYDERLPTFRTTPQFRNAIGLYVSSPSLFKCPATGYYYAANPAISGLPLAAIPNPAQLYTIRDAISHVDGISTYAYLNGSVRRNGRDETDPNALCIKRAQELTLAVEMYAQDYDETLPITNSAQTFQSEVGPYLHDPDAFRSPVTNLAFVPNATIGGKKVSQFADPYAVPVIMDPRQHNDGSRVVGYLDGHVTGAPQTPATEEAECVSNVRQICLATIEYLQDHDEQFPPTDNLHDFETALAPYDKGEPLFICPVTGEPYTVNAALNNVSLASLPSPSTTWLLKDSVAHPDGSVTIGYADGHMTGPQPPPTPAVLRAECLSNVKQISLATIMYEQDNDDQLPPTDTLQDFENAVSPYLNGENIFSCPLTRQPYTVNPAVSRESTTAIADPNSTWVIRDSVRHPDGTETIGYADGRSVTTPY